MHGKMHEYTHDLFNLYLEHPSMYDLDFDPEGFKWMSCQDADHSIVSFIRRGKKGELLLFVCNFTPVVYDEFRQAVPETGKYKEILNSDDEKYGGTGHINPKALKAAAVPQDGQEYSILMKLPPLSAVIFKKESK